MAHHHSMNHSEHHMNQGKEKAVSSHVGHGDHEMMVKDFRKRFCISLILTIPVLLLSPMIRSFLQLEPILTFKGDIYVLFIFSSIIFFYGGWLFLKGIAEELAKWQPGMMTLIAVAISTAYIYSSLIVFGLAGMMFFWELATLIDIMLFGHFDIFPDVLNKEVLYVEQARHLEV